jgi:Fe-S-cluster containining protein
VRSTTVSRPSALFDKTARWFERAHAALLNDLPCRQGCFHCCIGLFPITLLDQQELQRGLLSLPEAQRRSIEEAAALQVKMIEESAPKLARNRFIDHWPDSDIDSVVECYRALPCPALTSEGSCGLYAFRPLACRSMGIPLEAEGTVQGACAVQTSVPLIRLSRSLRQEEDHLAEEETRQLMHLRHQLRATGEELFMPYGFLPNAAAETAGPMA